MKVVIAVLVLVSIGAASASPAYENVKISKPCKNVRCTATTVVKNLPTK